MIQLCSTNQPLDLPSYTRLHKSRRHKERFGFTLSKTNRVMRNRHRSKRAKIENESRVTPETRKYIDGDLVPQDLVIEILRRLPVKSVARFLIVSKLWAKIIRSRDFIRSFPLQRSVLQPPLLFAFKDLDNQNLRQIWNFFSSSSTSEQVSYLSLTTCSNIMSPYSQEYYLDVIPHYVNGLISLGCGREQIICNPSTGKSITLPKVKSRKKLIQSFLGYDPVDGQYKVLCMSEKVYHLLHTPSFEHQVFTLGGTDKSWKMIECNILHRPRTNGVCINGVVYYGAFMGTSMSEFCLARFHVRSEKFDQVVQFLGDLSLFSYQNPYLISYKGKVTVVIETERMKYELWVLEDPEKHEWSKVCFSVHHPLMNLPGHQLRIRGVITHTEEIVFVLWHPQHLSLVYYDHKKDIPRKIVKIRDHSGKEFRRLFSVMVPFFNYVESVMLL